MTNFVRTHTTADTTNFIRTHTTTDMTNFIRTHTTTDVITRLGFPFPLALVEHYAVTWGRCDIIISDYEKKLMLTNVSTISTILSRFKSFKSYFLLCSYFMQGKKNCTEKVYTTHSGTTTTLYSARFISAISVPTMASYYNFPHYYKMF